MNRVSKISIKDILGKYVTNDMRDDIMSAIDDASIDEVNDVVGMSVRDYFKRFDDSVSLYWAADSEGFGKAGDCIYGVSDNLIIRGFVGLPGRGPVALMAWWDFRDWDSANKRFVMTPNDGSPFDVYARCWEDSASKAISDGHTDFTVSRWIGKDYDGHDLTNRVGVVSCGCICKNHYGLIR